MLYQTKDGQVLSDEEINMMNPAELEQLGVHVMDDWQEWN